MYFLDGNNVDVLINVVECLRFKDNDIEVVKIFDLVFEMCLMCFKVYYMCVFCYMKIVDMFNVFVDFFIILNF